MQNYILLPTVVAVGCCFSIWLLVNAYGLFLKIDDYLFYWDEFHYWIRFQPNDDDFPEDKIDKYNALIIGYTRQKELLEQELQKQGVETLETQTEGTEDEGVEDGEQ